MFQKHADVYMIIAYIRHFLLCHLITLYKKYNDANYVLKNYMESTLMLFTATMLVRSYRDVLTLSTGWRNTCLLVTTFTFLLFL